MFLSEWREFPSAPCLEGGKKLDDSSRLHVVEITRVPDIFPFLSGLRTYQHPGMCTITYKCAVTGADCRFERTYRLLQLLRTYPPLHSYNDELATILHTGNDRRVGRFFYTTLPDDGPVRPKTCRSLRVKIQGIHKRMVRFQKVTNLFLTLHGHNIHRQQRQLSKFLMRYQQFASHA